MNTRVFYRKHELTDELTTITSELYSWRTYEDQNNQKTNNNYANLLEKINTIIYPISSSLTERHLFIFTNQDCITLYLSGTSRAIKMLEAVNILPGFSFDKNNIGVNAISLCKDTNKTVVVKGQEHASDIFSEWACVCTPVWIEDILLGFLDLSFHCLTDITFAIPLIIQVSKIISFELYTCNLTLDILFEKYSLTKREKEIAIAWLDNRTVTDIACNYSISSHTVRTILKNIYYKVGVCSKGDFFRKFLVHNSQIGKELHRWPDGE